MSLTGIIQARMGSRRLPGKILKDLCGQSMLAWVVLRVKEAQYVDDILVATTRSPIDDAVVQECQRLGVPVYRGSEEDVLDRYYQASLSSGADVVVRITSDCPLIDPAVIDHVAAFFLNDPTIDYAATGQTYPEGYGVEVLTSEALQRAWEEASLPSEREHVTPYIWKHPDQFRVVHLELPEDLSHFRVTVDEDVDLRVVREIIEEMLPHDVYFGLEATVAFLSEHPEVASLNGRIPRQAGYWKSVAEDAVR